MSLADDAMVACLRANQAYYRMVSEPTTLSCGIALTCPVFPKLQDGNLLTEAVTPRDQSLDQAFDEVEAFYAGRGLTCCQWVPAWGSEIEPIERMLTGRGYRRENSLVMVHREQIEVPVRGDIRILPGRPMRRLIEPLRMDDDRYGEATRRMLAKVENERMDEPSYDVFMAMADDTPAGMASLYQVGDIGAIMHVFVGAGFRARGVGTALMGHLLALSRRLALRITVVQTEPDCKAAKALYQRFGFVSAGKWPTFRSPAAEMPHQRS